ncbi:MAG: response regulator [Bacteroidales bacterium]|nr:response regulator [Bacteroidales bacterium]MCF8338583.1 response regulator [Bacteroidales bacterium]
MQTQAITILIVDDIKLNYVVLKGMLRSLNSKILWARDHKEALQLCDQYDVDLVLMDFQLPGMNGLELSKKLKNKNKSLPIIFQTANAHVLETFENPDKYYEQVLEKPIQKEMLVNTLKQYVSV